MTKITTQKSFSAASLLASVIQTQKCDSFVISSSIPMSIFETCECHSEILIKLYWLLQRARADLVLCSQQFLNIP